MSDMHFGASNSLLTHIPDGQTTPDPTRPSPPLVALVDCLESVVATNEDRSVKPRLVLNGDILEFALASDETALAAFERFMELAFRERDLFDRTIDYLPGNHDHHMWEMARERQYAAYVARTPVTDRLGAPWHGTSMFQSADPVKCEARRVRAQLVEAAIHRLPGLDDVAVDVHYPNFGLRSDEAPPDRAVVFHHGHFVEPVYKLMTTLRLGLFPDSTTGPYPWDIEAENFAWIDFVWSTLGRSGQWGADVGELYDMLQEETAMQAVAANASEALAASAGWPSWMPKRFRHQLSSRLARHFVANIAKRERGTPTTGPLSTAAAAGLQEYVDGPLSRNLADECDGTVPRRLTFVFGHTHKAFERSDHSTAYQRPVAIYNTGGWVVDTLRPDIRQGAATILVDENLDVASLHWYSQEIHQIIPPVNVAATGDHAGSEFVRRLRDGIDAQSDPWSRLTKEVAHAIPERERCLQTLIAQGAVAAKARPGVDRRPGSHRPQGSIRS
jgi:hypothetical protein